MLDTCAVLEVYSVCGVTCIKVCGSNENGSFWESNGDRTESGIQGRREARSCARCRDSRLFEGVTEVAEERKSQQAEADEGLEAGDRAQPAARF